MKMNGNLTRLLGFKSNLANTELNPGTYIGSRLIDLHEGFHTLYVYCDLVQPRHVGNVLAPLLRQVAIDHKSLKKNFVTTRVFNPVYFLPLNRNHFETVEIDIRTDLGESVPFETGKVLVTLVFQKLSD